MNPRAIQAMCLSDRRRFLSRSGVLVGAAGLEACAGALGALAPAEARERVHDSGRREQGASGLPILQCLAIGLNAPSPHNTQPWLFRLESERAALLFVDRSRLLPATDPPARQIHIGCGCLLEAVALGATAIGFEATIALFPEGASEGLESVGCTPVARITLAPYAGEPAPLALHIPARQTSRLRYEGPLMTKETFDRIAADAAPRHSALRFVGGDDMATYLAQMDAAMTTEFRTRPPNEETRRWFRFSEDEAALLGDGLTFEANGITGMRATFARWFTDDSEASWNSEDTIDAGLSGFREALYSAKGLVLLTTDENRHPDHVRAGRDCYRLMLALTRHGYFSHPTNQVLQEYAEMDEHRRAFEDLTGIRAPAKVQMILRVGRSALPYLSHRRAVAEMVVP